MFLLVGCGEGQAIPLWRTRRGELRILCRSNPGSTQLPHGCLKSECLVLCLRYSISVSRNSIQWSHVPQKKRLRKVKKVFRLTQLISSRARIQVSTPGSPPSQTVMLCSCQRSSSSLPLSSISRVNLTEDGRPSFVN